LNPRACLKIDGYVVFRLTSETEGEIIETHSCPDRACRAARILTEHEHRHDGTDTRYRWAYCPAKADGSRVLETTPDNSDPPCNP
jgi:hypothetical protein